MATGYRSNHQRFVLLHSRPISSKRGSISVVIHCSFPSEDTDSILYCVYGVADHCKDDEEDDDYDCDDDIALHGEGAVLLGGRMLDMQQIW